VQASANLESSEVNRGIIGGGYVSYIVNNFLIVFLPSFAGIREKNPKIESI